MLLTALGCILMWGAGVIGPRLLNDGFLALAVGGWTGKGTLPAVSLPA